MSNKELELPEITKWDPALAEVDAHVRSAMQSPLDRLARERRLPVLG
jgi:hypothetical protein